jgi:hypothetical protein
MAAQHSLSRPPASSRVGAARCALLLLLASVAGLTSVTVLTLGGNTAAAAASTAVAGSFGAGSLSEFLPPEPSGLCDFTQLLTSQVRT